MLTDATHCGAGCAIGDVISEWLVFLAGLTLLGSALLAKYAVAFALAYAFGIFFQYFSIAPMRGLGFPDGVRAAVRADTLSLIAYEVGMFAWMAVTQKLLFPGLEPVSWTFWFMMQIAMMLGLATTFPMNWWLVRRGVKEAMQDTAPANRRDLATRHRAETGFGDPPRRGRLAGLAAG